MADDLIDLLQDVAEDFSEGRSGRRSRFAKVFQDNVINNKDLSLDDVEVFDIPLSRQELQERLTDYAKRIERLELITKALLNCLLTTSSFDAEQFKAGLAALTQETQVKAQRKVAFVRCAQCGAEVEKRLSYNSEYGVVCPRCNSGR